MKQLQYYKERALYWEGQVFLIGRLADKCKSLYEYPQLKKKEYEAQQEMKHYQEIVKQIVEGKNES